MNLTLHDGAYLARPIDIYITQTKNGKPQVAVELDIQTTEGGVIKAWFGSLSTQAAKDWTIKSVMIMGLEEHLVCLSEGRPVPPVNGREVEVVIQTEEYEGKAYQKIKYVNQVTKAVSLQRMSAQDTVRVLTGMNLKDEIRFIKTADLDQFEGRNDFAADDIF